MGRTVFHRQPGLEIGVEYADNNNRVSAAYAENATGGSFLVTVWLTSQVEPITRTVGPGTTIQNIPANRINRSIDVGGEVRFSGLDRLTVQGG